MKRLISLMRSGRVPLALGLVLGLLLICDETIAQEGPFPLFLTSNSVPATETEPGVFVSTGVFTDTFTLELFGTFIETLTLTDGTFSATTVITTTDGSTLLTEDSGPIFSPEPLDYQLDGSFTVTGGTGEFSGASGGGDVAGSLVFYEGGWIRQKGYRGHYFLQGPGAQCPMTPGFWKNHPEAWIVTSLILGDETYTQDELLTILKMSVKRDASVILAHQLIAAKLNIVNGSDPTPVAEIIGASDGVFSYFNITPPGAVLLRSDIGQAMVSYADTLDAYNNSTLTPDCVP